MRASLAGDDRAYAELLRSLAAALRAAIARSMARYSPSASDIEDIVQEALLSMHLKRHTWNPGLPVGPWVTAIAHNKLIDALRRRKRWPDVPLEFVADTLEACPQQDNTGRHDITKLTAKLKPREQFVIHAIALEDRPLAETAATLGLSEGAVRVLLHRTIKKLASLYRSHDAN